MATKNELTFEKVSSHNPTRGCTPFSVSTFGATISVFSFQRIRYHSIELPLTLRFWGCLLVRLFLGGTLRLGNLFCSTFGLCLCLWIICTCAALWFLFSLGFFSLPLFFSSARTCKAFSKRFTQCSRVSGALLSTTGTSIHAKKTPKKNKREKNKKAKKPHFEFSPCPPELCP